MPIIPNSQRTKEELQEMGKKGGKASAESRRRKKALHACKYDDIAALRREVSSIARALRDLIKIELKQDRYNYDLQDLSTRINRIYEDINAHEVKDIQRTIYHDTSEE